eukprot:4926875-Pyramimonas_sp.AAC.1
MQRRRQRRRQRRGNSKDTSKTPAAQRSRTADWLCEAFRKGALPATKITDAARAFASDATSVGELSDIARAGCGGKHRGNSCRILFFCCWYVANPCTLACSFVISILVRIGATVRARRYFEHVAQRKKKHYISQGPDYALVELVHISTSLPSERHFLGPRY